MSENILEYYQNLIVVDGLNSSYFDTQLLKKTHKAKMSVVTITVEVMKGEYGQGLPFPEPMPNLPLVLKSLARWQQLLKENEDIVQLALSIDDINTAKKQGKLSVIFELQTSSHVAQGMNDLDYKLQTEFPALSILYELGVRNIQMAYFVRNNFGDGCRERNPAGLSIMGQQLVEQMNQKGMIIDLSHCSIPTTMDTIEHSKDPVLFTHCEPYKLSQHPRNKTDEEMKAMAEKGGVIGITAYSGFYMPQTKKQPEFNTFMEHLEYAIDLIGIDHVGIGTDYMECYWNAEEFDRNALGAKAVNPINFDEKYVKGLEDYECFPRIVEELLNRGYTKNQIEKVMGENYLRVYEKVFK